MDYTIHKQPPRYRAYMLRLWEERRNSPDAPGTWRFSLEDAHTGEKQGFASLEALLAFLQEQASDEEGGLEVEGERNAGGRQRAVRSETHTESTMFALLIVGQTVSRAPSWLAVMPDRNCSSNHIRRLR